MSDQYKNNIHCSFCGKGKHEVPHLIAGEGKGVYICIYCIQESNKVINEKVQQQRQYATSSLSHSHKSTQPFPTPKKIHQKLNDYVIEQETAKKVLSVSIYNHYHRLHYNSINMISSPTCLDKSNILLLGESGTGKTLLASTLSHIVDVPFAIADATTLTEAGYVGDDVENILLRLIQNAEFDIERAEKGIIFIDEIDKIGRKSENPSITRDVSGEGVQQALLKIIEGTIASVPAKGGRRHPQSQNIQINTKNILFICGGAFVGLENIITNRLQTNSIGFHQPDHGRQKNISEETQTQAQTQTLLKEVMTDDLIKYGLIPELVGRLPIITTLHSLNKKALKSILIKPKNSLINQYKALLQMIGIPLEVQESALNTIATKAMEMKTGARGLRNILETFMVDIMYEAPDKIGHKVVLNRDSICRKDFFVSLGTRRKISSRTA